MEQRALKIGLFCSVEREHGVSLGVLCSFCGEPYIMGNYAIIAHKEKHLFLVADKQATCPSCGYVGLYTVMLFDTEEEVQHFFKYEAKKGNALNFLSEEKIIFADIWMH